MSPAEIVKILQAPVPDKHSVGISPVPFPVTFVFVTIPTAVGVAAPAFIAKRSENKIIARSIEYPHLPKIDFPFAEQKAKPALPK